MLLKDTDFTFDFANPSKLFLYVWHLFHIRAEIPTTFLCTQDRRGFCWSLSQVS